MKATTRRSNQMVNRVSTSSTTKANSALSTTTHQRSLKKTSRSSGLIRSPPSAHGARRAADAWGEYHVARPPRPGATAARSRGPGSAPKPPRRPFRPRPPPAAARIPVFAITAYASQSGRRGRRRADPRHRLRFGRLQIGLAVQCPAVDPAPSARWRARPRSAPSPAGSTSAGQQGRIVRGLAPLPVPGAELDQLGARLGRGSESEVGAQAVGQRGEHAQVGHAVGLRDHDVERAVPALPVDEGARPLVDQ